MSGCGVWPVSMSRAKCCALRRAGDPRLCNGATVEWRLRRMAMCVSCEFPHYGFPHPPRGLKAALRDPSGGRPRRFSVRGRPRRGERAEHPRLDLRRYAALQQMHLDEELDALAAAQDLA